MKKIFMIIALLGCALVYLQQPSIAQMMAQADASAAPKAESAATPAPEPVEPAPTPAPTPAEPAPTPAPADVATPKAEPAKKAESKPAENSASGKQSHADYAKMQISECSSCHKAEGVAPNHDADFVRGHRILAGNAGNNCNQCHQQKWCLDCHQGGGDGSDLSKSNSGRDYKPKSHRSDFINIHPMKALDNPQNCYRCHDQKSFCNSCHDRFPKGSLRIKSHLMAGPNAQTYVFTDHAAEARRNLQSCAACHPEGDVCIQCHSSGKVRPHPRNWKSGNFKDRTNEKVCLKCHLPGTY